MSIAFYPLKSGQLPFDGRSILLGTGLYCLLVLAPLALKLLGISDISALSWWWITMPFWGPWLLILPLSLALGVVSMGRLLAPLLR
ncbi:hypothetical protein GO988_15705 [Hymenobacter sp. HMF4947]|uniref:Uncharacterized protein n=1 Tax=Hymenobacter ginkgonis TaxID=2682976 RepID=A0A7K1THK0_9BACT|nr:hypothetical protein [Hymenobacter ginkgonis]MVN77776.1 hypothetical protein [Hymenobacter ginkgonis]